MCGKHFCLFSFLILLLFCGPIFTLHAIPITTPPITLKPEKFGPGTKVKVSIKICAKSSIAESVRVSGGVDGKILFQKHYKKTGLAKTRIPFFFWSATQGKHKIWFKIKRGNLTKTQQFERYINVKHMFKPLKSKKFVLKFRHKKKLKEIARLIVKQASTRIRSSTVNIELEICSYLEQYHSETEGAEHAENATALKYMEKQVLKQISDQEKQKEEKMIESQREYIKKLMDMIKELMRTWTPGKSSRVGKEIEYKIG